MSIFEITLFSVTMMAGFLGGIVIFRRSLTSTGRRLAIFMLGLGMLEVCQLAHVRTGALIWLDMVFFFELFCLCQLISMAISSDVRIKERKKSIARVRVVLWCLCIVFLAGLVADPGIYARINPDGLVIISNIGKVQASVVLMLSVVFMWIVENMIRSVAPEQRRVIGYTALGNCIVATGFLLGSIYRLSMSSINGEIFMLNSFIMLVGILILIYYSIRYRLFYMDIFVSRYVVYHSLTFIIVGIYLLIMGVVLLGVRQLGIEFSVAATGVFVFLVFVLLAFVMISSTARARLRFFINTHFYVNKYDYRKEWSVLSQDLAIAFDERQIVHVTAALILDSMYMSELSIWLRDEGCFRCVFSFPSPDEYETLDGKSSFLTYLSENDVFLEKTQDPVWKDMADRENEFLEKNNIAFAVAMKADNRMIGFIAVGRENPGTPYGQDDVDLLRAIALQSSAALMSARYASEIAENKEIDTFNRMSAYVLHDLKNAAGNLSLVLQNAPRHMDSQEFQQDMLEAVKESLARIDKVMERLSTVPQKEQVRKESVLLEPFIEGLIGRMQHRLDGIEVIRRFDPTSSVFADPEMLTRIFENLLVNAADAVERGGVITLSTSSRNGDVFIHIEDNGPGFSEDYLKKSVFKPFQTTKEKGTGLGLWQVKQMVKVLKGDVAVENISDNKGARVTLKLAG